KAVAQACAEEDFILEPTGGIHLDNFEEIISIALQAGAKQIIPHVYSSIIGKDSGKTRVRDVDKLYNMMKRGADRHGYTGCTGSSNDAGGSSGSSPAGTNCQFASFIFGNRFECTEWFIRLRA